MVLSLGHRHRANMAPVYNDVFTDSELTKQAERLAALEAEARANILQAQEKQKLIYSRRQLHGSVGEEKQTNLSTRPFGALTAAPMYCIVYVSGCQYMSQSYHSLHPVASPTQYQKLQ